MSKCTYKGCQNIGGAGEGFEIQLNKQGKQWAVLCPTHVKELNKSIKKGAKSILHSWIKARGGKVL